MRGAVHAPRLELAANSSAVLVGGVPGELRVFELPSLELRAEHPTSDLARAALSAGGRALIVLTGAGELLVHHGLGWLAFGAPHARMEIADLAVADDGASAALLVAGAAGRLERWTLPPAADVALELGAVGRGWLAADGELALVAAGGTGGTGEPEPLGAWALQDGRVEPVWAPGGAAPVRLVPFSGRVWGVWPDRLLGLAPGADPIELPGTAGERLAFSPSGRHLLAWRGEGSADRGAIPILLRVFDTATGDELFRRHAPVLPAAVLALTEDLTVLAVCARDDGGLDATQVAGP